MSIAHSRSSHLSDHFTMQQRAIVVLLAAILVSAVVVEAGAAPRKLLQYRRDSASVQLARNEAAATRTSYAINAAASSGANPYVTQGATYYGSDQAWGAANARRYGGWGWGGYPYYGKK